jgi:hypothetical protein
VRVQGSPDGETWVEVERLQDVFNHRWVRGWCDGYWAYLTVSGPPPALEQKREPARDSKAPAP